MTFHSPSLLNIKISVILSVALLTTSAFCQNTESSQSTESKPTKKWDKALFSKVNTTEKVIALTFDDGPLPKTTPRLLDILKKHDVKATFFVLGDRIKWDKDILKRTADEGHEIANHTVTHPYINKLADWQVSKELENATQSIKAVTGQTPKFFRPPFGAFRKEQADMIYKKYGMTTALWDVDPQDWQNPGASVIADRLVNGTKPGSILLGHDIMEQTVDAMDSVLTRLKGQGYRFVTLSELVTYDTPVEKKSE